jgi:hypothetical protein
MVRIRVIVCHVSHIPVPSVVRAACPPHKFPRFRRKLPCTQEVLQMHTSSARYGMYISLWTRLESLKMGTTGSERGPRNETGYVCPLMGVIPLLSDDLCHP